MTIRHLSALCGGLLLLLCPGWAMAQTGTVAGTVTDAETREPLPGATVRIEGLDIGAATDPNGDYTIENVPVGTQTVIVTFVGYAEQRRDIEVTANETTEVNFALALETVAGREVVVSGYRVQPNRVESGSVASVDSDELGEITARSADKALQGRAAGVRVTALSGQPGGGIQVQVRGSTSIGSGTQPLYIVDGVQLSNDDNLAFVSSNPLAALNPNDIESIEVLKDAAATSIYGANGANGVVIITTKKGRAGRTEVSFSAQAGTIDRIRDYEVFDASQFSQYYIDGLVNSFLGAFGGDEEAARAFGRDTFGDPDNPEINTNWQDQVFQTGITQQYNISLRGGSEETSFFISGGYTNDEGQIIASEFEQFALRVNLDHDVNDRLTVETNNQLSTGRIRGTIEGGATTASPFWSAQFIDPRIAVYNEPGNPDSGLNLNLGGTFSRNPVAQEELNDRDNRANSIYTQVAANYEILDGLYTRSLAALRHTDGAGFQFLDPRLNAQAPGSATATSTRATSYNVSQSLTFSQTFGEKHDFGSLLVAEYREEAIEGITTTAEEFQAQFRDLDNGATPVTASTFETEFRQLSFLADADYTYDNRYQIRTTIRRDGNSRFGEDSRFGIFGAISGFWRISEEAFMEGADFLDELQLRASYGATGNSDIGNFASRRLINAGGEYDGRPGVRIGGLGNNQLNWERVTDTNIGLDYALFNGRIDGTIDVYRRDRDDQLLGRDLPVDSGYDDLIDNVASTRNEGIELAIRTLNVDYAGFRWETNFNIAFQDTEVLDVGGNGRDVDGDGDVDEILSGILVYREGEDVGQFRYPAYAGVNPANGQPLYFTPSGELTYQPQAGDLVDEPLVGNLQADFFGGFGNTLAYKGLQLDMFWQFDYGRTTLDNTFFFNHGGFFFNKADEWSDYWREPGDVTDTPKPIAPLFGATSYDDGTTPGVFTQRFMTDASYIRLKQLQLSYSLPQSLLGATGISNVRLFVVGENLVTITDFTGPDPEIVGVAIAEFPQARTITGGIQVDL